MMASGSLESKPSNWCWETLEGVTEGIFDCPHTTPRLTSTGPFVVRSQDIRTGMFKTEQAAHVSEETYLERTRRTEPRYGDLLYSREGTYFGIAAEVPRDIRVCLGQRMVLIRPDSRKMDSKFLCYWLNSPYISAHVYGYRDGSVAERLNLPTIRKLPVLRPPIAEQKARAVVLGSLDEKIELNLRINQTLEATARAIFKSWFVDFDPVRIGHPLFRSGLAESKGFIPYGWSLGTLGEIAGNLRRGVEPSAVDQGTPYIGLEHMPRKSIALGDWGTSADLASNKSKFLQGEILFGKLRPYFHKVGVAPLDGICSTDILVIRPKTLEFFGIVLGYVSSDDFVSYADRSSVGTKMPRARWGDMARYPVLIPPLVVAQAYSDQIKPLVDMIVANIHQSRTLAAIRDALLPKLLSGEIRVKQAEKIVGEAV